MSREILTGYHFVSATLRDGRPVPPNRRWLVHEGALVICEAGLHASSTPWEALQYAPGPILCEVRCAEIADRHVDKWVCRRRQIVRRVDLTEVCRRFARAEARRVLHLWDAPEVVRRYLRTGNESIRAAAGAAAWTACDAARSFAGAAAWDAAGSGARAAAEVAAARRFNRLALASLRGRK